MQKMKSCIDAELRVYRKLLEASGGRTSTEIQRDERLRAKAIVEDKHRRREPPQDVSEHDRVHQDRVRAGAAGAPPGPARDELPGSNDHGSNEDDSNDAGAERDSSALENGEEKSPRPLHEWPEDDPYLMSSDALALRRSDSAGSMLSLAVP